MELFIGLYVVPFVICMFAAKVNSGTRNNEVTDFIIFSVVPVINIIGVAIFSVYLNEKQDDREEALRLLSKLIPDGGFQRLSPEAKEQIKGLKRLKEDAIDNINQEHKDAIEKVKSEDEQRILLNKLGLNLDDLAELKQLRNRRVA